MNNIVSRSDFVASADAGAATRAPASALIYRLQYLRAIAAFSVLLCHASYYVREYRDDARMWEIFARGGAFGVVLFFAISGYLMAQLAQNSPALRFMAHRLIRIYPIYWLCVFGVIAINRVLHTSIRPDPFALILAPGATRSYVLGVEWTLPFELAFYMIIFAIIALGQQKRLALIALVWIAIIELLLVLRPDLQQGQFPLLLHLPLSQYSLAFAAGLIVPFALARRYIGPATPVIAVAALAMSEAMPGLPLSFSLMCLGCALLVASAVCPRETGSQGPNRTLAALGDWSYALYLCHVPIIMALCKVLPSSTPSIQVWFAAIAAPVVAATLLGRIDLAMYGNLKKWVDRSSDLSRAALSAVFLVSMLGAGGYTYLKAIQIAQATAESAVVAGNILTRMNAGQLPLPQAAELEGLHADESLRGAIDSASHDSERQAHVGGWAADSTAGGRSVKVLLFYCGNFLGATLPQFRRPDVAAVLHQSGGLYGFEASFTLPPSCEAADVDGLVTARDGGYAKISAPLR